MITNRNSRSLHWERGLKYMAAERAVRSGRRSLHWERGLKSGRCTLSEGARTVVPCIGNVDWNCLWRSNLCISEVVPCIGNVDWNCKHIVFDIRRILVVPCIGNVDWNIGYQTFTETKSCRFLHRERELKCVGSGDRAGIVRSFSVLRYELKSLISDSRFTPDPVVFLY